MLRLSTSPVGLKYDYFSRFCAAKGLEVTTAPCPQNALLLLLLLLAPVLLQVCEKVRASRYWPAEPCNITEQKYRASRELPQGQVRAGLVRDRGRGLLRLCSRLLSGIAGQF